MSTPAQSRKPMVGRGTELSIIRSALDQTQRGNGTTIWITGESGVGKSRLAAAALEEAQRHDFLTATGRAHPVERGVAFALADAFAPLLKALPEGRVDVLSRGNAALLSILFPSIGTVPLQRTDPASSAELFWCFAQVVKGICEQRPLVVVLDDVQWADNASLELLHFLARQIDDAKLLIIAVANTEDESARGWRTMQQSLTTLGVAHTVRLEPLTRDDLSELVRAYDVPASAASSISQRLHERTKGNPFFAEEILKQLIERGDTEWSGSNAELPGSVRDAVTARLDRLSPEALTVAEWIAVVGTRTSYNLLKALLQSDDDTLVSRIEEAVRANVITEEEDGRALLYDFRHPLLRDVLYRGLSGIRRRTLHTRVAQAMESLGAGVVSAAEIAPHMLTGDAAAFGARAPEYLRVAGAAALARFADREAEACFVAALDLVPATDSAPLRNRLLGDLARARQRLGAFDEAVDLWRRIRDDARASTLPDVAELSRRVALALFVAGRFRDAIVAYDTAVADAASAQDDAVVRTRVYLERSTLLQAIGRVADASIDLDHAHTAATATADYAMIARVERARILLHAFSGPAARTREHAARAIDAAQRSGDDALLAACHWALGVHAGLAGNSKAAGANIARAMEIAERLQSPLLKLTASELAIEHEYSLGNWDQALAIGGAAIRLARNLNQRSILTRLLISTSMVHIGRDEFDAAQSLIDEAWSIAGAEHPAGDVHAAVPAHAGRAALHLARGEYDEAIRIGEAGLAIVDRTGYLAFAVHRLLPIVAEAYYQKDDFVSGRTMGERLRRDATYLEHILGIAFADTSDAIGHWLSGDVAHAVTRLRAAAEALDAVPYVYDAARLRRQLAGRLADLGERDAALRELRHVHDVFLKLGAVRELEKTRIQFREMGGRPPARVSVSGVPGLTGRELEIMRLIAARKSNKAIARELDLSARTVTTHMSNIFRKLGVSSRGELTDYARNLAP